MFIIVKEGTDLIYNCLFKSQKKYTRRDGELSYQLAIKLSTTTEKKLSYNICSTYIRFMFERDPVCILFLRKKFQLKISFPAFYFFITLFLPLLLAHCLNLKITLLKICFILTRLFLWNIFSNRKLFSKSPLKVEK